MAPAEGRRFFKFFSKPILLFPCCGSTSHVSEPGPGNRVSPEEPASGVSRRDSQRPAALDTAPRTGSKSEEASDSHPYHCPICFYFFSGEFRKLIMCARQGGETAQCCGVPVATCDAQCTAVMGICAWSPGPSSVACACFIAFQKS